MHTDVGGHQPVSQATAASDGDGKEGRMKAISETADRCKSVSVHGARNNAAVSVLRSSLCVRAAAFLALAAAWIAPTRPVHAAGDADSVMISSHRASRHPMRYYLALPPGWKADRPWPVLVAIPDAGREFKANLAAFVRARGKRPYILVAPEVLSCGGAGSRTLDHYAYTRAEWDSLQGGDDFAFEDAGLAAVLEDIRRQWHGESLAFLTGWEAGGHTVWAQTLRHPERWRGV